MTGNNFTNNYMQPRQFEESLLITDRRESAN
jgi:hypothetical protein